MPYIARIVSHLLMVSYRSICDYMDGSLLTPVWAGVRVGEGLIGNIDTAGAATHPSQFNKEGSLTIYLYNV